MEDISLIVKVFLKIKIFKKDFNNNATLKKYKD